MDPGGGHEPAGSLCGREDLNLHSVCGRVTAAWARQCPAPTESSSIASPRDVPRHVPRDHFIMLLDARGKEKVASVDRFLIFCSPLSSYMPRTSMHHECATH